MEASSKFKHPVFTTGIVLLLAMCIVVLWLYALLNGADNTTSLLIPQLKNALLGMMLLAMLLVGWVLVLARREVAQPPDRRVEKTSLAHNERLSSFIESPEHVSIYSLDRHFHYTGFNDLHLRDMKASFGAEVAVGTSILKLLPEEMASKTRQNFLRALRGEHFTVTSQYNNGYFTQVFSPVYDQKDQVVGLTSNIFNVTDRIRAEQELENYKDQLEDLVKERTEQLERQTNFFQQIIDNLPNLIFVRDKNSRYILVNQMMADSFGCAREDLLGKKITETHRNQKEAVEYEREDGQIIEKGSIIEEEALHPWPGEKDKWLLLSKRRMEIGEDKYILGVHFDITYLKETELKLQKANQELQQTVNKLKSAQLRLIESEKMASLGQLTAGLAHEINNPINYASGNIAPIRKDLNELKAYLISLETLNREFCATGGTESAMPDRINFELLFEELESLLKGVDEGTSRVKSLMNDLNAFSLPEGARRYPFNINDSIRSTINLVHHHLKDKITLERDLQDLPKILCSPQQINQVFLNVFNNAIQAISGTGRIRVSTRKRGNEIVVRISDTGCGISRENISRVFEPFYTTKEVGKGTGLGLAISYRIIEDHGGTIEVTSEPGKGSIFQITLPFDPG